MPHAAAKIVNYYGPMEITKRVRPSYLARDGRFGVVDVVKSLLRHLVDCGDGLTATCYLFRTAAVAALVDVILAVLHTDLLSLPDIIVPWAGVTKMGIDGSATCAGVCLSA